MRGGGAADLQSDEGAVLVGARRARIAATIVACTWSVGDACAAASPSACLAALRGLGALSEERPICSAASEGRPSNSSSTALVQRQCIGASVSYADRGAPPLCAKSVRGGDSASSSPMSASAWPTVCSACSSMRVASSPRVGRIERCVQRLAVALRDARGRQHAWRQA